jgi:tRNA modification GTPase
MTSKGTGAISTIQLFGEFAEEVIKKTLKPDNEKEVILHPGQIYVGTIFNGRENLDQVTIGCTALNNFSINCHGNPLIVSDIMKLLAKNKVKLVNSELLLAKIIKSEKKVRSIAIEAKTEAFKALTIEGVKIINNQIEKGLAKIASNWLGQKDTASLEEMKASVEKILKESKIANLIIYGCKAVLVGPPNTGKSTLLNRLAGKEKAIVTDIEGTTRDWVSFRGRIGRLSVEFIDTAGLDEALIKADKSKINKASQLKSMQMFEQADLILLVLDKGQLLNQLDKNLILKIEGKNVLTILNKSDLESKLNENELPSNLHNIVSISAKNGTGLDKLFENILKITHTGDFDLSAPLCFTSRQKNLLKQINSIKTKEEALSIITELLNGDVIV